MQPFVLRFKLAASGQIDNLGDAPEHPLHPPIPGSTRCQATVHVVLELPDVNVDYQIFSGFWLQAMFGGGISSNHQVGTLAATYVRLVESAIREYQMGVTGTKEFWSTHSGIALGAIQQATSHFESCISDMHRSIKCFTRLRRHRHLGALSVINGRRPIFIRPSVHDKLREARDAIHHMEEMVMKGKVAQGQSTAIRADGPEVVHPSEEGQTIKTIDRLTIGSSEILLADVARWLAEMAQFCELMIKDGQRQEGTPVA